MKYKIIDIEGVGDVFAEKLIAEANELVAKANAEEAEITAMVEEKIKS
jgi:hypothetical protein